MIVYRLRSTGQASLITFSRKNEVLWTTARKRLQPGEPELPGLNISRLMS